MKNKKIVIFLGLLFIFGFIFKITPIIAITIDKTVSTVAEKDTYVDSNNPTSNYGGVSYAKAGIYDIGVDYHAFFYFNFTDKPTDFTKAEISLYFEGVYAKINFTVSLVNDSWSEFSMNWINSPPCGDLITNLVMTQSGIHKIDITNLISTLTNISICVYIEFDNYITYFAYITSREGYLSDPQYAPQLIWTYPETREITVTSPTLSSNWQDSNTYTILWDSLGPISEVIIELYKGSTYVDYITSYYTENDGEYNFYVSSAEDYEGTDYRIKITDHNDASVYDFSNYFSINAGSSGDSNGILPSNIPSYNVIIIITIISTFAIIYARKTRARKSK